MESDSLDFLKSILSVPSPSGFEQPVSSKIRQRLETFADEVETDVHGNTWGVLNPKGKGPSVMLAGHCDEIGLMITYINEQGFIAFGAVGGINVALLQGSRVRIHTKKGDIPGVVTVKAIHLMTPEERSKPKSRIQDLWIDIGARNRKDAEKVVRVGDPITIDVGYTELRNGLVAARGFDDRIGAFTVTEALRLLKGKTFDSPVYAVATVQEEIGLRGAHTAAYGIDPDVGIAVDVTFASDCPDVNKKMVGDVKLGAGPVLHRGANINPVVEGLLEKAAKKARIKTQLQASPRATGTDANAIQLARGGKAAALVSIPNRYMHSPAEVCCLRDAENAAKLLAAFVLNLKKNQVF
ncbi:MAG: M42 family metallopeptidase, partial [Planctomycetota bacterium]